MNETQKKGSGCGAVALVIVALALAGIVAVVMLFSFVFKKTKRVVTTERERIEARHKEPVALRQGSDGNAFLKLRQDKLADYARYQAGVALDRDVFVSWSVDPLRTTLGMEAFRGKAEGAMVTWEIQAEDLTPSQDKVVGDFRIPYGFCNDDNQVNSVSSIQVRCEFGPGAGDALLAIRRGDWVNVRGRLSLKGNSPVILDATLAGTEAESRE